MKKNERVKRVIARILVIVMILLTVFGAFGGIIAHAAEYVYARPLDYEGDGKGKEISTAELGTILLIAPADGFDGFIIDESKDAIVISLTDSMYFQISRIKLKDKVNSNNLPTALPDKVKLHEYAVYDNVDSTFVYGRDYGDGDVFSVKQSILYTLYLLWNRTDQTDGIPVLNTSLKWKMIVKKSGNPLDYIDADNILKSMNTILKKDKLSANDFLVLEGLLMLFGNHTNTSLPNDITTAKEAVVLFNNSKYLDYVAKNVNAGLNSEHCQLLVKKANMGEAVSYWLVQKGETFGSDESDDKDLKQDESLLNGFAKLYDSNLDTSLCGSEYSNLHTIVKTVGQILKVVMVNTENTNTEKIDQLLTETGMDLSNYSAYDRWSMIISTAVTEKSIAKTSFNFGDGKGAYWNLSKFDEYMQRGYATASGQKDALTQEEVLRLKAFCQIISQTSIVQDYAKTNGLLKYPTINEGAVMVSGETYTTTNTVMSRARSAVQKYMDMQGVADLSEETMLTKADLMVQYLVGRIVGGTPKNPLIVQDANVADEFLLEDCEYFESMLPSYTSGSRSIANEIVLSQCKKIPYIAGGDNKDEELAFLPYDAYAKLQALLVVIESYAARIDSGLTTDDDKTYSNSIIDEFKMMIEESGKSPEEVDVTSIVRFVKVYVPVKRALEYLGYETKSPALKAMCEYATFLETYEDVSINVYAEDVNLDKEPLGAFFDTSTSTFTQDYLTGVALSSTYIPMKTNVYETSSLSQLEDLNWVQRFHYPFGFYRKALYIDTDVSSAVNWYVTGGSKGSLRVATLKDLLEPEKDIMLYVDDNFYNVNKLAEMQGYSYSRLANTSEAGEDNSDKSVWEFLTDQWANITETSIEDIVKTGPATSYSGTVRTKGRMSEFGSGGDDGAKYVFRDDLIKKYLTVYSEDGSGEIYNEYTPLQSFAVVSSIYRKTKLWNIVDNQSRNPSAVFISSPTLASIEGVSRKEWNTIYNYIMLKNLEKALGIDYKSTLDLDSPIYMDIYGNILTESGLVIIPAASNATLYKGSKYNLYTTGFLYLYDKGEFYIANSFNNSEEYLKDIFEKDEVSGYWELKEKTFYRLRMYFKDLSLSNETVRQELYDHAEEMLYKNSLTYAEHVYLITEVLRGAPIENIDKEFEGLTGNISISKYGIYMAYKLEELTKSLLTSGGSNSLIQLPNLAFMSGFEYVVLFLFKVIFAGCFVLLFYVIYKDSVMGCLGIKTMVRFTASIMLFIIAGFSIPKVMDISYYQFNKMLLQDEASYIEMLNLEKRQEGREIGVYEITAPETTTELFIKMEDLSIPWYDLLDDILTNSTFTTVKDAYEAVYSESLLNNLPGMEQKGGDLYMSLDTIFENSQVNYYKDQNLLYLTVLGEPYASYVVPYYTILEQLICRINEYNTVNEITNYTTKIMSQGSVKTLGIIEPYLTSDEFMLISQDILGMRTIYGIETTYQEKSPFSEEDIQAMEKSMWFVDNKDKNWIDERLSDLEMEARVFVSENRDMLGKVSDETFLEIMAMTLAVKYNDVMSVASGSAIEIYSIDTRDLIRLSLVDRDAVIQSSSKSFARFVYDNGGTLGVVVVAVLYMLCFVSSFIKPVCIGIVMASSVGVLVIRRIVKRDKDSAIEGFIITLALLAIVNILYALLLKLSLNLPELGLSFVTSALLQILLQVLYIYLIATVVTYVCSDLLNLGFNKYVHTATSVVYGMGRVARGQHRSKSKYRTQYYGNDTYHSMEYAERTQSRRTDRDILAKMLERDERRRDKYGKR